MGRKMNNLQANEDRISDLPDPIIQHILSFLPSTKDAIQTSLLSKRWNKQWTCVPVLIFSFSRKSSLFSVEDTSRMSSDISTLIDNVLILHECPKIKKFHIYLHGNIHTNNTDYDSKLCFAIRKDVEELILNLACVGKFKLPDFVFNCASLVTLQLVNCTLMPQQGVSWANLKHLYLRFCSWRNQDIKNVVSGSPFLESLVINYCQGFNRLDIASTSLKRLDLVNLYEKFVLEISCPKLEELHAISHQGYPPTLSDKAIQNALLGSPSLKVLELNGCKGLKQLVIHSSSLKKLVLADTEFDGMAISCPSLEELNLKCVYTNTIKFTNPPSLICATLDLDPFRVCNDEHVWPREISFARQTLEQLHHVKELKMEGRCIKVLSAMEMRDESFTSLKIKCLTLNSCPNFLKSIPAIAYALRSSPELEKLVINLQVIASGTAKDFPLNVSGTNYWDSNGTVFDCLVSHLKIVKIVGLSEEKDDTLKLVLDFVEFFLRNARVLEKMVFTLKDCGPDFVYKVCRKFSSFPKFSQRAVVELLCFKSK